MRFPHFVLAIVVGLSPWILQGSLQQDIGADITRAENLYYQAHYTEADTLLASLSDRLNGSGASANSQVQVKMLLGLTRFVLGNEPDARSHFLELCVINPGFVLDEHQFAPKVVSFFKGVHADCWSCRETCFQASSLAGSGDLQTADSTKTAAESSILFVHHVGIQDQTIPHFSMRTICWLTEGTSRPSRSLRDSPRRSRRVSRCETRRTRSKSGSTIWFSPASSNGAGFSLGAGSNKPQMSLSGCSHSPPSRRAKPRRHSDR